MSDIINIKSVSELHRSLGLEQPKHPAVSLVNMQDVKWGENFCGSKYTFDFYMISLKDHDCELKYGRNYYDFEEGSLVFVSPGQLIEYAGTKPPPQNTTGWTLYFHPDLIRSSPLGANMSNYTFFSYAAHEALHLSDDERNVINDCIKKIIQEYEQNIDKHSQTLIVSNLELLLNYCSRFYDRQFYTRQTHQQDVISKIETLLIEYFGSDKPTTLGLPTVKYCAEQVNLSPNYLSDLLKKETGKNTKEHIDYFMIDKAKSLILTTEQSISEIAYELGFVQPQNFSKMFKKKVGLTPKEYRNN